MDDNYNDTLIERVRQLEIDKWIHTKRNEDHAAFWMRIHPTVIVCILLEHAISRLEAEAKEHKNETH